MGGVGAILTLHHVRPARSDRFQPNQLLEVTPKFLERLIAAARALRGRPDLARRDAPAPERAATSAAASSASPSTTAIATIMEFAYPILKKYERAVRDLRPDQLPRPDRRAVVAGARSGDRAATTASGCVIDGERPHFSNAARVDEKRRLFDGLYAGCAQRSDRGGDATTRARSLPSATASTWPAFCADLCMDWDELATLAADPLVTIGAHTVNHADAGEGPTTGGAVPRWR